MVGNLFFVFILDALWLVNSMEGYYQPPRSSSVWGYFAPPLLQRLPSESRKSAMETMVDLTNNLGVAILQDNSFSKGNFAFSPYGVASVLVVLYEGTRGESARQIHRAIGFPPDKDLIRIGFRDIHRNLRSYFSHEGYLSGISLNKETSSLKPEYKKILRFYGYDVDLNEPLDTHSTSPTQPTASTPLSTEISSASTTVKDDEVENSPEPFESDEFDKQTTTQKVTEKDETSTTESPWQELMDTQNSTETTITSPVPETVTTNVSEISEKIPEIEDKRETNATETGTTTTTSEVPITTTEIDDKITTVTEFDKIEDGEFQIYLAVENTTKEKDGTWDIEKENSATDEPDKPLTTVGLEATEPNPTESETKTTQYSHGKETTNTNLDNGMLIPQVEDQLTTTTVKDSTATEFENNTLPNPPTETTTPGTEKTTDLVEQIEESKSNLTVKNSSNENGSKRTHRSNKQSFQNIRSIINTKVSLWLGETNKKPSKTKRTITDYLKTPHRLDISLQLQNGMFDTHVSRNVELYRSLPRLLFLVDGAIDTPVPMMTHTNIFPYAYIPRLHSKALEFPLDDIRYKLLILLPVERRGLRQLTFDLTDFPLSNVLDLLTPTRVRAMVPTFMVEGFVILTSSLQKLGIWDVFDPRKANLSGMSMDPELFVRNVEQSVTVVIRNYVEILDIQTRTMAARRMEYEFEVTHPFLYFVLDTATNVALMAGQILDPLNSRIY